MTTQTCPVCGLEQTRMVPECTRCCWDFAPLLGTPEQVQAILQQRLEQAKSAWSQQAFRPDRVPELTRDPFETLQEYAARLTANPWFIGEGELRKSGYELANGRFPFRLISVQDWVQRWLHAPDALERSWVQYWLDVLDKPHLRLPRDQARELYRRSGQWPVYARLGVSDDQAKIFELTLLGPEQALLIWADQSVPVLSDRYRDFRDGTVKDLKTGLQWMRCAIGRTWAGARCRDEAAIITWDEALARTKTLNQNGGYAGHNDWRVPTIDELKTLIYCSGARSGFWSLFARDDRCLGHYQKPTLDHAAFPDAPCGWFWSASPVDGNSSFAWHVNFNDGYVHYGEKDRAAYVRLVRGGQ